MTNQTHTRAEKIGRLGRITLTRPDALNALTRGMILDIHAQLKQWAEDDEIQAVLLRGEGRAFCAGGDIKAVWETVGRNQHPGGFFWDEYLLDHAIHHYSKPVVSFLDGFVMGGGAGISILGSHRVATEATRFAMPETAIGFYPDAGGTFFLSRLDPVWARYLGVTGVRIDGADCLHAGLATHFIAQTSLGAVEQALAAASAEEVDGILANFAETPQICALMRNRSAIERSFGHHRLGDILTALAADDSDWGAKTRKLIDGASPSSMALTLKQLDKGKGLSLAQALVVEYRLSVRRTRDNDFNEGVRARLVDRSRPPAWAPQWAEDVSDEALEALFLPLGEAELPLS